jgi:hypothetical protein
MQKDINNYNLHSEEQFWKDVVKDEIIVTPPDEEDCEVEDKKEFFDNFKTKCKNAWSFCFNHEIGRWMIIFFGATLVISFLTLLIFNPPLVQVNKRLDKTRSATKIIGFTFLFAIFAAILVPIVVKCWSFYKNKTGSNNVGNQSTFSPHLELTKI